MKNFDLPHFIFAMIATAGMVGIGISLAQKSPTLFVVFTLLSIVSVGAGFMRKKFLRQQQVN